MHKASGLVTLRCNIFFILNILQFLLFFQLNEILINIFSLKICMLKFWWKLGIYFVINLWNLHKYSLLLQLVQLQLVIVYCKLSIAANVFDVFFDLNSSSERDII